MIENDHIQIAFPGRHHQRANEFKLSLRCNVWISQPHTHIHIAIELGRAFDARAEHDDQRHAETLTRVWQYLGHL